MPPKEDTDNHQIATCRGQSDSGSSRGYRARSPWRQHHGLLQAVQCKDAERARWNDFSGAGHDLYRPHFHVHPQDPPASVLLLRAAGIAKGSPEPNRNKVGKVTKKQVEEIAKIKLVDLNTTNLDSAIRTVSGTARNMGLDVVEA